MITIENKIRINKKDVFSNFAKAGRNINHVKTRPAKIGSALSAVNKLMSYSAEIDLIMPSIINVSPNHTEWNRMVTEFFHGLTVSIPDDGLTLDISLIFDNKKKVYNDNRIQLAKDHGVKLDTLEQVAKYVTDTAVDSEKIDDYTVLLYAYPRNPKDYLLYLYCLGYRDVANNIDDVNKSEHIRFYIYRESEEKSRQEIKAKLIAEATSKLGKALSSTTELDEVFYLVKEDDIMSGAFDRTSANYGTKVTTLSDMSTSRPEILIKVIGDKTKKQKATVLEFILFDVLKVTPLGSTILTQKGDKVGSDLDDAVKNLFSKENETLLKECEIALKDYKNR